METKIKVNAGWSWLYNEILKLECADFRGRPVVSFCLKRLRRHKIAKTKDFAQMPLVLTKIDGKDIVVPLSHELAFYKKNLELYDQQIVKTCHYVKSALGELAVIDVGANVGDTVVNVGIKDHACYLCVEGDAVYYRLLRHNLGKHKYRYKAIPCFLTDEVATDVNYKLNQGGSSAELRYADILGGDKEEIPFRKLDDIVKEMRFTPNILKIDTDGFDFKVLRGSKTILQAFKPALFFEWDGTMLRKVGENPISIFSYLYELGYKRALLFDNYGNELVSCFTHDIENLSRLTEYTYDYHNQIQYYDVLLFHEESVLSIDEFEKWCHKNK